MENLNHFLEFFYIYEQEKPGIEKIIFHHAKDEHFTLHFGTRSKVCDIHHTRDSAEPPDKHTTLVQMKHSTVIRLVAGMRGDLKASIMQIIPVERRFSWFKNRSWRAQRIEADTLFHMGIIMKDPETKRTKFHPDLQSKDLLALTRPITPRLAPGGYLIHGLSSRQNKIIGTLFVREGKPPHFYYLPWERQMKWARQLSLKAIDIMRRTEDEGACRLADQMEKISRPRFS